MRILAVDDDPLIRALLATAMRQSGFGEISFAVSGETALDAVACAEAPFDTFLLDVMMPGIDGISLCRKLRAMPLYRSAPIIMITADRQHDSMSRAFDAGATDYVSKPFDGLELGTRINLAGLLTDSLRRERESQHKLEELSRLTAISFDERFDLEAGPGVKPFLTLENDLLRQGEVLHAMTLFDVQINRALELYRGMGPAPYRALIEAFGAGISSAIDGDTTRFAHAGRGAFVGIVYSRERIDLGTLHAGIGAAVAQQWRTNSAVPSFEVSRIEDQRLWSARSAAEALRSFHGRADLATAAEPVEINGLFERLRSRLRAN